MQKIYFTTIFFLLSFLQSWGETAGEIVKGKTDWQTFMNQHDLTWDSIPHSWDVSPFMGNGNLGLMIYQEPGTNSLRLETGSSEVHDHRPDCNIYGKGRLLTGHFNITPIGKIQKIRMRLDLWNAETTAHVTTSKGAFDLKAFVSATQMVICVMVTNQGQEKCTYSWIPAHADSPRIQYSKLPAGSWMKNLPSDYVPNPQPEITIKGHSGLSVQKLWAGGETAICWNEIPVDHGFVLLSCISHSYPQMDAESKAKEIVAICSKKGLDALEKEHQSWWHQYYQKSFLALDDKEKEKFYWIQMYKYGSATRGDCPLIDNCGPWLTVTPWPNAWWNLNVELTYWALNASNHLDLARSLENALYGNLDHLRQNVPEPYRADSYGIGRSSGMNCLSDPVDVPGTGAEVGDLTWACHNLWLIYRHQMDDEKLRQHLFPLLKGAINYYLHFIYRDQEGKWHLPSTLSPEYGNATDCNYDLALLKWGCMTLMAICDRLHIHDDLYGKWKDVATNMTLFPQDENGLRIGADQPYAQSHRHYSHLLAIYPLAIINPDKEEDRKLIETSLAYWHSKKSALRGYSFTGASSIAAMLGKGDEALKYLNGLFTQFLSPTTMYREAGPVIETPLSGAKCIQDMLLQSWGDKIRVFPAVPSTWRNITFDNWLAEGAFNVSARRVEGKTTYIHIASLAGEPCQLITDISSPEFKGPKHLKVKKISANSYRIFLKKGDVVTVTGKRTE